MGDIIDYQRRVKWAMQRLESSTISEEDRKLIKDFVHYKVASDNIKLSGQDKYLRFLVVIAERYLGGRTYASLTREDVMEGRVELIAASFRKLL